MIEIFRGYVQTKNKRCVQKFGSGEPLLTLEDALKLPEFAGVLNGDYVVVDIDNKEHAEMVLRIIASEELNCRIYRTPRGYHFAFASNVFVTKNHTHKMCAIGIEVDIRCGKNAYIVLQQAQVMREVIREFDESRPVSEIPKWLAPVKGAKDFTGMTEGDGRNSALFGYIGTLTGCGFSKEETRDTIRLINRHIFSEPLDDAELAQILRDEAFKNMPPCRDPAKEMPPYIYFDPSAKKLRVNCPLLARYIRENVRYFFVKDSATGGVMRYFYEGGAYRLYSDEMLKGVIKSFITSYDETLLKMNDVNEVYGQLTTDLVFIDSGGLNGDESIINFQNGVLHLPDMKLLPASPDYYSTIQIPCDWVDIPAPTPVFDKFMVDLTEGNTEIETLLLQFMGACLSNIKGWRLKKALFMVGKGDTGKSQLKRLTERLLGKDNYSGIDLKELEARFGTGNIYGKRLAGSADMSFVSVAELKTFKKCTGGDSLFAEFKGQNSFVFVYNGLLWFCMNQLPKFGGDNGEWVYNRIMQVVCDNVIPPEKQDKHLLDKMYAEREGIVHKAVIALNQVILNGYEFSEPESVTRARSEYRAENSTVISFFTECMQERPDGKIRDNCTTGRVYDVYKAWCADNNHGYAKTAKEFRTELAEHLGTTFAEISTRRGIGGTFYRAFTLTTEAKQNYAKAYGYEEPYLQGVQ